MRRLVVVCITVLLLAQMAVRALEIWAEIRYYQQQEEEAEVPLWVRR